MFKRNMYADNNRNIYLRTQLSAQAVVAIVSNFSSKYISNVTIVTINKQRIRLENCFGLLS